MIDHIICKEKQLEQDTMWDALIANLCILPKERFKLIDIDAK